jgi:hypothetical protein
LRAVRGLNPRRSRPTKAESSAGDIPEWIGPYVSINLACLDEMEAAELASLPVTYMDGRGDNWMNPPAETRYL